MPTIRLTDAEWALLEDEPAEALKVYVELRRRMDFTTCIVGQDYHVSEQIVRETLTVPSRPGRKADNPTRKKVRYIVDLLCRIGLLEQLQPFVFRLPYALGEQSEQNRWGQGGAKVGPEVGPKQEQGNINQNMELQIGNEVGGDVGLQRFVRGGANIRVPVSGKDYPPDGGSSETPGGVPPCPHQKIIDLYEEILPMLPTVRRDLWNGSAGADALKARWKDDPRRQSLDWWRKFFTRIAEGCPFLIGQAPPNPNTGKVFRADLRWIVKRENFIKIMEGKFTEDRAA